MPIRRPASDQEADDSVDALRESEARFRLLLETLPHIAFVIRKGGLAEHYNQRFVDYLGFSPGPDKQSRSALHHPDDQAQLDAARAVGVAANAEYIVEARIRRHDGAYRWHRIHNKPLLVEGRTVAWLGTAVNIDDIRQANEILEARVNERTAALEETNRRMAAEIAERKRAEHVLRDSEERYRRLYNRTPMALQSVDANARLLDVNDTWLELFGFARDEVIGRRPTDFMAPESAQRYSDRAWPEMLASGGRLRVVEYRFITKAGCQFDGRLAARGEFAADGSFVRSWAAIADITIEKRAEHELRQAQRSEAVGRLSAGVAHDFNNLLTAVLGNLALLERRLPPDDLRAARQLGAARNAAERCARVTSQLLAFSRQQQIAAAPIDLNRTVDEMRSLLESSLGGTVELVIVPGPGASLAMADPTQIELVILNLAINARDAMPDGGVITIATADVRRAAPERAEEPDGGDYVAISVSDTGTGIPDAARERMFEPFFTTKEIGKGSGLGLPQVLGVAKQLGGGVAVATAPGQGTTVSVFLPRANGAVAAARPQRDTEDAGEGQPEPGVRVLLVDDDKAVRAVTSEMLRDAGHVVIEADGGRMALNTLQAIQGAIDLMIVDVAMPSMNGVELARIARQNWPTLPVLFITGYAETKTLASEPRGSYVLNKPFALADLLANAARALGRQSASPPDDEPDPEHQPPRSNQFRHP